MDARAWLTDERRRIDAGTWSPPASRNRTGQVATLRTYAAAWLADRPVKPSTRDLYGRLLDQKILPALGDVPLKDITPLTVRQWYASFAFLGEQLLSGVSGADHDRFRDCLRYERVVKRG